MSGGSWEYMYGWDTSRFLDNQQSVAAMAKRLTQLGHADAGQAMEEFALLLLHARLQIETRQDTLKDVMHAVEWHDSSDYGKEQVSEVVRKWRYRK
jgi:hypothetical protein